jgi:dTDP-4-amino-4,6-dideoxygalactose transaminase
MNRNLKKTKYFFIDRPQKYKVYLLYERLPLRIHYLCAKIYKRMRKISMVDLHGQYERIKPEIDSGIQQVIDSSEFINGSAVKQFSKELSDYLSVKHVLPCANGTDALQIALMAIGCEPGDEIITVPFTFVATVEVIALLKLKPVFVDIDPATFNIDISRIEEKITPRTKAIIPVHLFGQSADMERIMEIAGRHKLIVIEDNAQAIGSNYTFSSGLSRKAGTIGHIGTTSFYPTKNLGAYGDGGALFTNDDTLAEKMKIICDHGSSRKYYYDSIGVNSRLDSIQAAILHVKLQHLDEYCRLRRHAAEYYNQKLRNVPGITIPAVAPFTDHVYHQYTLLIDQQRDELKNTLMAKSIPSMIYYPVPLHLSSAYKIYGYEAGDFPVSENCAQRVLSLPMHTELEPDQIDYISNEVIAFVNQHQPVQL